MSYAGYRALAHLALACRYVEFSDADAALAQTEAASQSAGHMEEKPLAHQRQRLAGQVACWIKEPPPSPLETWQRLEALSEPEHGWYIQVLSAQWMGQLSSLQALVPLALDNPTALDAVLGRLVGTMANEEKHLPALAAMADAMNIPTL